MKIIFFGTPNFAATNLQYLIGHNFNITAVVTLPDSKKGRGRKLKSSAVKETAIKNNITVLQPEKLRDDNFLNKLKNLNANLFVVVAFRMLPEILWNIPSKGTINLHTSLLPNYRGAAPINWVLINGEKETGITTFFINGEIDSGAIISQERTELTNDMTAARLHNILMDNGNKLLTKTLQKISNNTVKQKKQVLTSKMRAAPKLTKDLLRINWNKSAEEIHNLIRGLSPFIDNDTKLKDISICPSAWFFIENNRGKKKRIKIHFSKIVISNTLDLLKIETDNKTYLHIGAKKDKISILNLQAEGKKPMTIQQFLKGNKITENYIIS